MFTIALNYIFHNTSTNSPIESLCFRPHKGAKEQKHKQYLNSSIKTNFQNHWQQVNKLDYYLASMVSAEGYKLLYLQILRLHYETSELCWTMTIQYQATKALNCFGRCWIGQKYIVEVTTLTGPALEERDLWRRLGLATSLYGLETTAPDHTAICHGDYCLVTIIVWV